MLDLPVDLEMELEGFNRGDIYIEDNVAGNRQGIIRFLIRSGPYFYMTSVLISKIPLRTSHS